MDKLDANDRQILRLLQTGDMCIPSATKLAHEIGIPTTTVHSKLKRLKEKGAIKGYIAEVDGKSVDHGFTLFAIVKSKYPETYKDKKQIEDFSSKVAKIPEVQEVHVCSGDWDFLLKIKAKSQEDYYRITTTKLLPIGGIERLESFVTYNTFKESPVVQVD